MTFTVFPAVPRSRSKGHPPHAHDSAVILNDAALQNAQPMRNTRNGYTLENPAALDDNGDVIHLQTFSESAPMLLTENTNADGRMSLDTAASVPPVSRPHAIPERVSPAGSVESGAQHGETRQEAVTVAVVSGSPIYTNSEQPLVASYSAEVDGVRKRRRNADSPGVRMLHIMCSPSWR